MTRDERYAALPGTAEDVAKKYGFNYSALCQLMRIGWPGEQGSRTREMAEAVAKEIGLPYSEVWGGSHRDG